MDKCRVGVVGFDPRILSTFDRGANIEDPYELGDYVPIIMGYLKTEDNYIRRLYWAENNIKGLKVGDPVIMDMKSFEIYELKKVSGLGMRPIWGWDSE